MLSLKALVRPSVYLNQRSIPIFYEKLTTLFVGINTNLAPTTVNEAFNFVQKIHHLGISIGWMNGQSVDWGYVLPPLRRTQEMKG